MLKIARKRNGAHQEPVMSAAAAAADARGLSAPQKKLSPRAPSGAMSADLRPAMSGAVFLPVARSSSSRTDRADDERGEVRLRVEIFKVRLQALSVFRRVGIEFSQRRFHGVSKPEGLHLVETPRRLDQQGPPKDGEKVENSYDLTAAVHGISPPAILRPPSAAAQRAQVRGLPARIKRLSQNR